MEKKKFDFSFSFRSFPVWCRWIVFLPASFRSFGRKSYRLWEMPTGAAAATIKKQNKHFLSTVSRRQSTKKNLKRRSSFFLFTSGFLPFIFPSAYESVDSQPHKKTKQSYKRWSEIKIIHHHQKSLTGRPIDTKMKTFSFLESKKKDLQG
jgi:hypothetical protein